MKLVGVFAFLAAATLTLGAALEKRATVNDVATVGYAALNGGTTGGSGGTTVQVSTLAALTAAAAATTKSIIVITASLTGNAVVEIAPNKTVVGANGSITLTGIGLRVLNSSNVIIRNLKIAKVLAPGDNIGIQASSQVWVDHVDLSSDLDHDKDFYDGLLDITHGCTGVTVTNSFLHDHWKASLIGHSDNNGAEDVAITVTLADNYWENLNSRTPSLRFGHAHIFNNYYVTNQDGINTRDGAQVLAENNVWTGCKDAIYDTDNGFAVATGNDYGGLSDSAPVGNFTKAPYSYTLLATASVAASVKANAGALLSF